MRADTRKQMTCNVIGISALTRCSKVVRNGYCWNNQIASQISLLSTREIREQWTTEGGAVLCTKATISVRSHLAVLPISTPQKGTRRNPKIPCIVKKTRICPAGRPVTPCRLAPARPPSSPTHHSPRRRLAPPPTLGRRTGSGPRRRPPSRWH